MENTKVKSTTSSKTTKKAKSSEFKFIDFLNNQAVIKITNSDEFDKLKKFLNN